MAELSFWWTTNGTGDGSAAGYTQTNLSNVAEIVAACSEWEGVAPIYLNACAPSSTGNNNCRIASGGAVVDGKIYRNTANVDVVIPDATGGNTRIDRVVLRADWTLQTVRVTRIAGVDGPAPAPPDTVTTTGVTYDITLAQVLVTDAGVITITDERVMASPFHSRQGGSATNWSSPGTTNYAPGSVRIQIGVASLTVLAAASFIDKTVTFPTAFSGQPIVLVTPGSTDFPNNGAQPVCYADTITTGNFVITVVTADGAVAGADRDQVVMWYAVGAK